MATFPQLDALLDGVDADGGKSLSSPLALSDLIACPTPADLARISSRGKWKIAPHLAITNRYIMDLAARVRTRVIISMPPRHGKSQLSSRTLPAWWLGNFPDDEVVITSYGADLAAHFSGAAKGILTEWGPRLFDIHVNTYRRAGDDWSIYGHEGSCRSAGVGGAIIGRGADLLIIDDPFKNLEEAHSSVMREKVWGWFLSTAYTRLSPTGVVIVIATRWHEDDLIGRIIKDMNEGGERYDVINFPAIAEQSEPPFPTGLGRRRGEALWSRFPLEKLLQIKRQVREVLWNALYQGHPQPLEGGMFKRDNWRVCNTHPRLIQEVRFWDCAATEAIQGKNDPDYVVGVRGGKGIDGNYYITNVVRFRGDPGAVHNRITATIRLDGHQVRQVLEQEPASQSKIYMMLLMRELAAYSVRGQKPEENKQMRAETYAGKQENHFIYLYNPGNAPWIHDFVDEHAVFPSGLHDDQVDAGSGWFTEVASESSFSASSTKPVNAYTGFQPR